MLFHRKYTINKTASRKLLEDISAKPMFTYMFLNYFWKEQEVYNAIVQHYCTP